MKNRKGFTLIELLAVIVILAIIALIAVPKILNIIEDARKSSVKDSAYGYVKSIENKIAQSSLKGITYEDREDYAYEDIKVDMKGTKPTYVRYSLKKGIVESGVFCIDDYIVNYTNKEVTVGERCNEDELKLPGNVEISVSSENYTYPNSGKFKVTTNISGGALSCTTSDKEVATCSISKDEVTVTPGTKEGQADITVKSAATSKHKEAQAVHVAITAKGTLQSITANGYKGIYDGEEHGITVSTTIAGATIKYGESNGTYDKDASPTYKDAGTYTVYYQITKEGYNTITGSKDVVINKAEGNVTAPTAKTLLATGSAQTLINEGSSSTGTIEYKLGSNGTWSTNLPSATNAGTYTVYYRVLESTNYQAVSEKSISVTIVNASCSITMNTTGWATSKTATITGSPSTATLQYKVESGDTIKTDWTAYSSPITIDWEANTTTPTYIYCRMTTGTSTVNGEIYTETKIDRTTPGIPTITGGSSTWVNSNKSVSISVAGTTGASGLKHYNYLVENYLFGGVASIPSSLSGSLTRSGNKFTTTGTDPNINFTNLAATNVQSVEVYLNSALTSDLAFQVFYASAGQSHSEANSTKKTISKGATSFNVDIPDGNYDSIRFDFGSTSGITFDVKYIRYIQTGTTSNNVTISNNGQNIIYYQTVSNVGLKSSWTGGQQIRLDKTAPTCTSSGGNANWTNGNITLTGTCKDIGGSGCKANVTKSYSSNTNTTTASPGTVSDNAGNTVSCPANQTVKIDKSTPTAPTRSSTTSNSSSITAIYNTGSATSGIASTNCYRTNSSGTVQANGTLSGNNCVFSGLSANTTYYFKKCITSKAGNTSCSGVSSILTAGGVTNFGYTGGQQTYKTPCNGSYKLEVWGAQGGSYNSTYRGGYGGYASGMKNIANGTTLYVNVGGQGGSATTLSDTASKAGGYNGGGTSHNGDQAGAASGGGGATHIATRSGILSSLSSYKSNILIVAGGGGGGFYYSWSGTIYNAVGGAGGGTSGGSPSGQIPYGVAAPGTQTSGAAFGQGASGSSMNESGGGGGYYGGTTANAGGAAGGSGYIGGVTSGTMTTGAQPGNGYARITVSTCSN